MTPAQLSPVTREGPQQLGCGCPKPLALSTRVTQWSKGRSRQTHVGTLHPEKDVDTCSESWRRLPGLRL